MFVCEREVLWEYWQALHIAAYYLLLEQTQYSSEQRILKVQEIVSYCNQTNKLWSARCGFRVILMSYYQEDHIAIRLDSATK